MTWFFLALDNYSRPQFCSHFIDGNSTCLPDRVCEALHYCLQDAVRFFGGRCNIERNAQRATSAKFKSDGWGGGPHKDINLDEI